MKNNEVLERIMKAIERKNDRSSFDIHGAAEYLGVSRSFLDYMKSQYKVPFCRVGGRVLFRKADLDKFLEDNVVRNAKEDRGRMSWTKS